MTTHSGPSSPGPARSADAGTFWGITYHTLGCLEVFLTGCSEEALPVFKKGSDGAIPRDELLPYLVQLRQTCEKLRSIAGGQARELIKNLGFAHVDNLAFDCGFGKQMLFGFRGSGSASFCVFSGQVPNSVAVAGGRFVGGQGGRECGSL